MKEALYEKCKSSVNLFWLHCHSLGLHQWWSTFCATYANFFKREYRYTIPSAISCNDVISHH